MTPLVSIIIPSYNHEQFIWDCLQSLINQSYERIELLICDDASTDATYQIVESHMEELKARFERVVLKRNSVNRGVTGNINQLLLEAAGEYIKILASDDALTAEAIETYVKESGDYNTILVSNGSRIEESERFPFSKVVDAVYKEEPDFSEATLLERVFINNNIFAPGAFLAKRVFDEFGMYDESIAIEDLEYWLRLLSCAVAKFKYIKKSLVYYRINSNSLSSNANNSDIVNRRKRFFNAEKQILLKYRNKVSEKTYAMAVSARILNELAFAKANGLSELTSFVRCEIKEADFWKGFSIKEKIIVKLKIIKRLYF